MLFFFNFSHFFLLINFIKLIILIYINYYIIILLLLLLLLFLFILFFLTTTTTTTFLTIVEGVSHADDVHYTLITFCHRAQTFFCAKPSKTMLINFTRQLSQFNRVCLQAATSNGLKLAASRNVTRRIVKKRFASTSSVSSSCCLQRRRFTAGIHKLDFRIPIVFKPRRIRFRGNSTLKSTRAAAPASGGKVFPRLLGFAAFAGGGYYLVHSNDIIADLFWGLIRGDPR